MTDHKHIIEQAALELEKARAELSTTKERHRKELVPLRAKVQAALMKHKRAADAAERHFAEIRTWEVAPAVPRATQLAASPAIITAPALDPDAIAQQEIEDELEEQYQRWLLTQPS